MFDDLIDPAPPVPTAEARARVERRSRTILRRRRTALGAGGAVAALVLVVGGAALFNGPTEPTTEVAGLSESAPGVTSSPVTEPVSATGPLSATVTGDLAIPEGFEVLGCTVNGAAVDVVGTSFTVEGLSAGTVVDIVCEADSGDGAARAARESVELVEGANVVTLEL